VAGLRGALVIREIEQILFRDHVHYEARSWVAAGAVCRRDRHRYSGSAYSFTAEVLLICYGETGRAPWRAVIVSERWTAGASDAVMHGTKWLRLISGKAADLRDWIHRSRPPRAV
jgi:hypothetical protein